MVFAPLGEVRFFSDTLSRIGSRTSTGRHPRERGDPVRRGFSVRLLMSLEYWVTRFRG
jgi:hypothetical protein